MAQILLLAAQAGEGLGHTARIRPTEVACTAPGAGPVLFGKAADDGSGERRKSAPPALDQTPPYPFFLLSGSPVRAFRL